MPFVRLEIAAQTDIGRRKKNNEDFYGVFREGMSGLRFFEEGALLAVADGLGGHMGGEIASKLAVNTLRDMLKESPPPNSGETDLEPLRVMERWMHKANDAVFHTNEDLVRNGKPMGTTLIAALIQPHRVLICNVGDSRCYLIREGEIISRTEDHSWVDEQVKQGLMSKAEAEADSRKNVVTRSVGTNAAVQVDSYAWQIEPDDVLLLCSDGLINMAKDTEIIAEFRKHLSPAETATRLINMANENGGKDNTTVIIAHISPSLPRLIVSRTRFYLRKSGVRLWWFLLTLLMTAGGFAAGYFLGQMQ
jgi:serine/threonine protein phosphatase PrpC